MVAIRLTTNTTELNDVRPDWEARVGRLHRRVNKALSGTVSFVVNTKLRLQGVAVRLGGVPGPTPGTPGEPVLHRDTGALAGSIMISWPKRMTSTDLNFLVEIGLEASMLYGPTQEFGDPDRGIPARPFMAPAADRLSVKVQQLVGEFMT